MNNQTFGLKANTFVLIFFYNTHLLKTILINITNKSFGFASVLRKYIVNSLKLLYIKMPFFLTLFLLTNSIGFCQSYLGWVTQQVNLRQGPGINYSIITSLKPKTQIYIVSLETENDFYNVIDIATNNEGYIHKSLVKLGEVVVENEKGMFTSSGKILTYDPEIEIFNNTNLTLTLKLNSEKYTFLPKQRKIINAKPGMFNYRASAPGVIPIIGTEYAESNTHYIWEFYVVTRIK